MLENRVKKFQHQYLGFFEKIFEIFFWKWIFQNLLKFFENFSSKTLPEFFKVFWNFLKILAVKLYQNFLKFLKLNHQTGVNPYVIFQGKNTTCSYSKLREESFFEILFNQLCRAYHWFFRIGYFFRHKLHCNLWTFALLTYCAIRSEKFSYHDCYFWRAIFALFWPSPSSSSIPPQQKMLPQAP